MSIIGVFLCFCRSALNPELLIFYKSNLGGLCLKREIIVLKKVAIISFFQDIIKVVANFKLRVVDLLLFDR